MTVVYAVTKTAVQTNVVEFIQVHNVVEAMGLILRCVGSFPYVYTGYVECRHCIVNIIRSINSSVICADVKCRLWRD